jgi:predicted deacylase
MNPLTVAEKTDYRETSRHSDVLAFIEELRKSRPVFRVESMGRSAKGQEMPVLVFGERPGTPVVLVIANIHAGEVEGKEALLMLARDLPEATFHKLTLLFIPDYNPDGNDLIDPKNRALDLKNLEGQIGPEGGVGTRYTGEGINLNRDYIKMEAVESRNLSALIAKWRPHLRLRPRLRADVRHLAHSLRARGVRPREDASRRVPPARGPNEAQDVLLRELRG